MAYKIEWTLNAREDLKEIIFYLQQEWSIGIAENFIVECYSKINLIAQFPHIGATSEKIKSVRSVIVTKHNTLYYLIEEDKIVLLNFFDTRQHPKRNKY